MGYDINTAPPRPWFCGHVYLKEAKRLLDGLSASHPSVHDVTACIAARINVMRGIRVAVKLIPEDYAANDIIWTDLDTRIGPERYEALRRVYQSPFRYDISGTGQYGVPNFDIVDRQVPRDQRKLISTTTNDANSLLAFVVQERIQSVRSLLSIAIDIFFWDSYVPEKQYDIHYYDIRENLDRSELLEKIVEFGFAEDEEDAEAQWGEAIDDDSYTLGEELDAAFRRWNEETFYEIVNDDFWGWTEDQAIYHHFSDCQSESLSTPPTVEDEPSKKEIDGRVYGELLLLNEIEAKWCQQFTKTHDTCLRVEIASKPSGWTHTHPPDMVGTGIEEAWDRAAMLYNWLFEKKAIRYSEMSQLLYDHRSLAKRLKQETSDGETFDSAEMAQKFLDFYHVLQDPVLYISPQRKSFRVDDERADFRATRLVVDDLPLGRRIDVRGLDYLKGVSGYREYNASGMPREGHVFLVTEKQEQALLSCDAGNRLWITTGSK
jgi:hypothetical protein